MAFLKYVKANRIVLQKAPFWWYNIRTISRSINTSQLINKILFLNQLFTEIFH